LDKTTGFDQLVSSIGKYGARLPESRGLPHRNLLEVACLVAEPFPVVADSQSYVELVMDLSLSEIPHPTLVHESYGGSLDQFYGNKYSFRLNAVVMEEDFKGLLRILKPLYEIVRQGYTYMGSEEEALLTTLAQGALDKMHEEVGLYRYVFDCVEAPTVWDFYADEIILVDMIETEGLTKVLRGDSFFFDYSTTDLELRKIVALELYMRYFPMNEYELLAYFLELRDACKTNYSTDSPAG
jgi:hypothetical protein